jgi:hypothetical protein
MGDDKLFALYQGTTSSARQQAFCFVSRHDVIGDNKLFALYQGTTSSATTSFLLCIRARL